MIVWVIQDLRAKRDMIFLFIISQWNHIHLTKVKLARKLLGDFYWKKYEKMSYM